MTDLRRYLYQFLMQLYFMFVFFFWLCCTHHSGRLYVWYLNTRETGLAWWRVIADVDIQVKEVKRMNPAYYGKCMDHIIVFLEQKLKFVFWREGERGNLINPSETFQKKKFFLYVIFFILNICHSRPLRDPLSPPYPSPAPLSTQFRTAMGFFSSFLLVG